MATIDTRINRDGTKSYRVRWVEGGTRRTRTFRYRRDADTFERNLERARAGRRSFDPDAGTETLTKFANRHWEPTLDQLSRKGKADYLSLWKIHLEPALGEKMLRDIEPSDVRRLVLSLSSGGLSPSRTRKAKIVLSLILSIAVEDRRIESNPCDRVKTPTPRRRSMRVATRQEIDAIVAGMVSHRDRTMVQVFAATGMRWAEVAGLQVRHVDAATGRLRIVSTVSEASRMYLDQSTKTHRERVVVVPKWLRSEVRTLVQGRGPSDYVFRSRVDGPIWYSTWRRDKWLPACRAAGVELTVHELRHYAATRMLRDGSPVPTVSQYLGHSSPKITWDLYAWAVDDDLEAAAETFGPPAGWSADGPQSEDGDSPASDEEAS